FMINNQYSGTLNINNLNQINKLYEMMKEAILHQNTVQAVAYNPPVIHNIQPGQVLFTTTNMANPNANPQPKKMFMTVKGQKIFNIIKESNVKENNRRKSVTIVYDNNR